MTSGRGACIIVGRSAAAGSVVAALLARDAVSGGPSSEEPLPCLTACKSAAGRRGGGDLGRGQSLHRRRAPRAHTRNMTTATRARLNQVIAYCR